MVVAMILDQRLRVVTVQCAAALSLPEIWQNLR